MSLSRPLRLARRLPGTRRAAPAAIAPLHTSPTGHEPSAYQTIGLAIFDGCEISQVPGFGDTLAHTVRAGGPGPAALRSRSVESIRNGAVTGTRRIRGLERGDWFEDGEEAGVIKPTAILRLADASFREYIVDQAQRANITAHSLRIHEQTISIPAVSDPPPPKGIIHYTVNGPRLLPVDIYSSLSSSSTRPDLISGEVHVFSGGGKGEYCGSCRVEYLLRRVDGDDVRPVDARGLLEASGA